MFRRFAITAGMRSISAAGGAPLGRRHLAIEDLPTSPAGDLITTFSFAVVRIPRSQPLLAFFARAVTTLRRPQRRGWGPYGCSHVNLRACRGPPIPMLAVSGQESPAVSGDKSTTGASVNRVIAPVNQAPPNHSPRHGTSISFPLPLGNTKQFSGEALEHRSAARSRLRAKG